MRCRTAFFADRPSYCATSIVDLSIRAGEYAAITDPLTLQDDTIEACRGY
jgi:hypothetical protein